MGLRTPHGRGRSAAQYLVSPQRGEDLTRPRPHERLAALADGTCRAARPSPSTAELQRCGIERLPPVDGVGGADYAEMKSVVCAAH
jgi:hypothetical protein